MTNMYDAPAPRNTAGSRILSVVYSLGAWGVLLAGVLIFRVSFDQIYKDFELELPVITKVLLSPLFLAVIAVVGLLFTIAAAVLPHPLRRAVGFLSWLAWAGTMGFVVLGFFLPLIVMIQDLSG